ncbi:MAG TPA: hypothetical protein VNG04_12980, partial [Candidatus Acidoferrum sp.]|nr:hypothetical protein [Candidatus Acidoferrum sp.]
MDDRLVFGQKAPDPDRRHHLAVRKVMGGLSRGPLAARGVIELFVRNSFQGVHDHAMPFAVSLQKSRSFLSLH